jgi:hypothetical protein
MRSGPDIVWASTAVAAAGSHGGSASGWVGLGLLVLFLGVAVLIVAIRQRSRRNR